MAVLQWEKQDTTRVCKICDRTVLHEKLSTVGNDGVKVYYYLPVTHVGMCGRLCLGGWIDTGEVHVDLIHDIGCSLCEPSR